MKPKVIVEIDKTNMPEDVTDALKPYAEVVYTRRPFGDHIKEAVGMLVDGSKIDAEFLDKAPVLKVAARFGVGYDNVDVEECSKREVYVTHTPGVLSGGVADHTWALILGFMRRIPEADTYVKTGWGRREKYIPFGWDMEGKVLGFLGLGRIGSEVLKRSQGFDTVNQYYDIVRNEALEEMYGVNYVGFEELLRTSDIITVHVPLLPSTRHILGENEFNMMKESAVIVNTSRGPVIDEKAMTNALMEGTIRGVALDVFEQEPTPLDNPLLQLDNVVVSPHCASATWETRRKMANCTVENVLAYLKGDRPPNVVPEQRNLTF
jgi:lactate dehydrogenase-like 2-hydroxyacid dehydrogenase